MKWLGQYIQDLTARFRHEVYLENISSGTIVSGGNLGLDSNNKIVKATLGGSESTPTDITVTNESTDTTCFPLFVTAATGDLEPKTRSSLTFNSSTGVLNATGFTSSGFIGDLQGDVTGNADTADALATARTIAGTSFNGTANIDISYDNLTNKPTIPTNNNQLTNGAGYTTNLGDITGVKFVTDTGDSNCLVTSGNATFNLLGGEGVDIINDTTEITISGENATIDNKGVVELATTSEADTGTDTARAVTPAGLKSHVDARHTYVYLQIHGRSSTSNDNWHFQDGSNDGEFNWEDNSGADAFADSTNTTVGSSTLSISRDVGVMGFVIPYDCTLIGFKAIGRDLSGNDEFKAGLWSSPVFSGYGGSTAETTFTLRAVATASTSGGSGGNFNGICKLDDLSQSYSLSAGQILLPSLAETDTSRSYLSMTIVLKVPII